jgi:hypothetical protein
MSNLKTKYNYQSIKINNKEYFIESFDNKLFEVVYDNCIICKFEADNDEELNAGFSNGLMIYNLSQLDKIEVYVFDENTTEEELRKIFYGE